MARLERSIDDSTSFDAVFMVPESLANDADCSTPKYFYDGNIADLDLPSSTVMRGSERLTVFDGSIPREVLSRVSRRRKAASGFELCESKLELTGFQRDALRDFVRE